MPNIWPHPGHWRRSWPAPFGTAFICTSGKQPELYNELLQKVDDGARSAGRDTGPIERMIEIKISYDPDLEAARQACHWWAGLALSAEEKSGTDDPIELERLADPTSTVPRPASS